MVACADGITLTLTTYTAPANSPPTLPPPPPPCHYHQPPAEEESCMPPAKPPKATTLLPFLPVPIPISGTWEGKLLGWTLWQEGRQPEPAYARNIFKTSGVLSYCISLAHGLEQLRTTTDMTQCDTAENEPRHWCVIDPLTVVALPTIMIQPPSGAIRTLLTLPDTHLTLQEPI